MKKRLSFLTAVMLAIMVQVPSHAAADRLTVVASVFPLFDFAREVAGTAADVRLLLPPGVDPHSWEPKPSDIVDLSQADIFVYTSERMEPWADNLAKAVQGRGVALVQVMDSQGFTSTVCSGQNQGEDPHFWLDLSLSARTVEMIGRLLASQDPENKDSYIANARAYAHRLEQLDQDFMTGLKECGSRRLVTGGHAAFGHLARRYGIEQISVYGLTPDAEPTPRHLAGIVNVVKDNKIHTIFSEELMNPRMAQVLSQETGATVMVLNPGANLTGAQWREGLIFLEIMDRNLKTLREGLECD
ncbi:MAG: zinc ABC transporter substrate-binding protein [bacterium]|nr:zinc ABC transporter substrate-binding protein [bacterium]MDT8365019.1 zinc ABC transporter substrate-binding protein [bacterium]